jgi:isocitrate dehydrogenase (NAD+)
VDIVLVRENLEGLYVGVEHFIAIGGDPRAVGESTAIVTRAGCERIIRYAFEYAIRHKRKKVTIVHKANILKLTDGLFLETARDAAKDWPQIQVEDRIVDNMAQQLVLRPQDYDVLLCPNLYGDILSDLCAALVGGLGVAPGANLGRETAIFEAVHGSAPQFKGQDKLNPTALILTACMMLDHLHEAPAAERIRRAVRKVIAEGKVVTGDLGGSASTTAFTDEVIRTLGK